MQGDEGPGFGGALWEFFSDQSLQKLPGSSGIVITNEVHKRLDNNCLKKKFEPLPIEDNAVTKGDPFWSHSSVYQTRLCRLATFWDDKLNQVFRQTENGDDRSDLWYMLFHTKSYRNWEHVIEEEVNGYTEKEYIRDARVHSLLGSYELAVAFRASDDHCKDFAVSVERRLRGHLNDNEFLVLNVIHEYVRDRTAGNFTPTLRLWRTRPVNHDESRCIQGLISLRYRDEGEIPQRMENKIKDCVNNYKNIVWQYSITGRAPPLVRSDLFKRDVSFEAVTRFVIEFLLPCGSYSSLIKFSKDLEYVISDKLEKTTCLAYKTYQANGHSSQPVRDHTAPREVSRGLLGLVERAEVAESASPVVGKDSGVVAHS